jgi:hypothetical protein
MSTPDTLFILCCILAIVIAIVFSFVSIFIYKREQVIQNPYYHCSTKWQCCSPGNPNCDSAEGVSGAYKPASKWVQGSDYHQNCVLPVQNAILNYQNTPSASFSFTYLYEGGTIPANNPSVYYPGCTGPGGTGDCANPALNPQYEVGSTGLVCPYVSFDAPPPNDPNYLSNNGALPSGTSSYTGNGATLQQSNWGGNGNIAAPYIAGTTNGTQNPGNNYIFPFKTNSGQSQQGQYTGGPNNSFVGSNSQNNTFHGLTNAGRYIGNGNFS